jgi:glycosyltransferase involved in cell wall biosynthesis
MTTPQSPIRPPRRHAVVVSFSAIGSDLRIRRQIGALIAQNWRVTSLGFGAGAGADPTWRHIAIDDIGHDARLLQRSLRVAGLLAVRWTPELALRIWRSQPRNRALVEAANRIDEADLVVANDYPVLPACAPLAARLGAGLLYDTHEYAAGERDDSRRWRLLHIPYIRAIESAALRSRMIVTTVSSGIAAKISEDYRIAPPIVIRNMPSRVTVTPHPTGLTPLVHYHGVIAPGRGLETLIDSVALWEPRFRLRIRGPGAASYSDKLRALARARGLLDRVMFEDAAPADELIQRAADADIGIHVLPPVSYQNSHALPNKLFEYLMAGLAVIVSDLPAMREIVVGRDVGRVVEADTPAAIAAAVNSMKREDIARFREAALASSATLCWEKERSVFVDACEKALVLRDSKARPGREVSGLSRSAAAQRN